MKKLEIVVSGRVQGVSFRYFTVRLAQEYNILGNVRNTLDGNVRIVAVGDIENMELFLRELHKGPRSAFVENIQITELAATSDFKAFRIEY